MSADQRSNYILGIKDIDAAIKEAQDSIDEERSGEQLGLYSRWNNVNRAMGKYFRFSHVTMIAGGSGAGKSYMLNMLEDDFTSAINSKVKFPILVLSFKYEMDTRDELIRTVASRMNKSYSYLISSEYNKDTKEYNQISEAEAIEIKRQLDLLKTRNIKYFEVAGNLTQLEYTAITYRNKYPDHKFVITIDHSLLSKKDEEVNDLELMANTGLTAIRLRKKIGANVIILNQLNGEIEKSIRKENPALHYPVKTDIHCGNQVFWACDNVIILHRPKLIGIDLYGKRKIPTTNLLHGAVIKSRKGNVGDIWFREELDKTQIHENSEIGKTQKELQDENLRSLLGQEDN